MSAEAHTFGLEETLIEPQVLPPPPTRHALLTFLIALAAILHMGTVGWSDIQDGAEGEYASAARDMWRAETWSMREPPLSYWLTVVSFRCFGGTAVAARLPVALAMVASVALTFLIGERLGGYWRGFVAGLVHLCALGSFIWARMVTPQPLFAAAVGATMFCVVSGYQRRGARRVWFAAAWLFASLACLTNGIAGILLPGAVCVILACLVREARLRFRLLIAWPNVALFLVIVGGWLAWMQMHDAAFLRQIRSSAWLVRRRSEGISADDVPLARFVSAHLLWWFPASLAVLPGIFLGWRKVIRAHEFDFADVLPLCWLAAGFLPLLLVSSGQDFSSLGTWSAFALFAAAAWDRIPGRLRLLGLVLTAVGGIAAICAATFNLTAALPNLPTAWLPARAVLLLAGCSIVLFAAVAARISARDRETLAIAVLLLGMVPIGMSAAEGLARYGSYLSLAEAARVIQPRLNNDGEVFFEGSAAACSSLRFYLDRAPVVIGSNEHPDAVINRFRSSHPAYLVIPKTRVTFWQERITSQLHIYHQETTCGAHVVLSNQP
ncbi:MAG: glycosyltransferase family 39 protein [Verrucomicrobiota bacterium]|nr:glycosyltransferase family 39 protein [Verrucomicrobiota bacterium]